MMSLCSGMFKRDCFAMNTAVAVVDLLKKATIRFMRETSLDIDGVFRAF